MVLAHNSSSAPKEPMEAVESMRDQYLNNFAAMEEEISLLSKAVELRPVSDKEDIKESRTVQCVAKDNDGERKSSNPCKKHDAPSLNDEIWHLSKVRIDGETRKKMPLHGIATVKDFIKCYTSNPTSPIAKTQRCTVNLSSKREMPACDVFINHRGIDTKRSVSGLLYEHLTRLGLKPFFDNMEKRPGDKLFDHIDEAIHECKKIGIISREGNVEKDVSSNRAILQKTSSWVAILTIPLCLLLQSKLSHPRLKEEGSLSIWLALLGMFTFTAFLSSVFIMVLAGSNFTRKQILILLSSALFMNTLLSRSP